jgi:hypothetical protein
MFTAMGDGFDIACQQPLVSPVIIGLRKHPLKSIDLTRPRAEPLPQDGQNMDSVRGDFVRSKLFESGRGNLYVS